MNISWKEYVSFDFWSRDPKILKFQLSLIFKWANKTKVFSENSYSCQLLFEKVTEGPKATTTLPSITEILSEPLEEDSGNKTLTSGEWIIKGRNFECKVWNSRFGLLLI